MMKAKLCLLFFIVCFLHACSHNSDLQTTKIAIKNITLLSQKDMENTLHPLWTIAN